MGGPNSTSEIQVFLRNMFSDPCIIGIKNNYIRGTIGKVMAKARSNKSKKIYEKIGGSSPITKITFDLCKKLQEKNSNVFYTYAMRYVPPYADAVLSEVRDQGIKKIVLFSMYPQYSTTTTLSSLQDVKSSLHKIKFYPEVQVVDRYFDNQTYISVVCNEIQRCIRDKNPREYRLILSAHSIPSSLTKQGDPYEMECNAGAELIKKELQKRNLIFKDCILAYQSKLGPIKWLGPSTQEVISESIDKVIVYPLSFTIDNSETDYELDILCRERANSQGIEDYVVCRCLNDSEEFVHLIDVLTGGYL